MFYLTPPRHISTLPKSEVQTPNLEVRCAFKNGPRQPRFLGPKSADIAAKVFLGRTKILRATDALYARRREGPYRFIQNRSRTSVVSLKSDAAADACVFHVKSNDLFAG
jgi:hypothetical protein